VRALSSFVVLQRVVSKGYTLSLGYQKETVKSGTTGGRITPVSCRGHPRRSFFRPNIQSWNPATGCGASSASGCLAGEYERNKTQPFHHRSDHQYQIFNPGISNSHFSPGCLTGNDITRRVLVAGATLRREAGKTEHLHDYRQ
jgi:hypothetical protein